MTLLYTASGYAVLLGLGYGVYHFSFGSDMKKRGANGKAKSSEPEARKQDRKKKQRMEAFALDAAQSASKTSPKDETNEPRVSVKPTRDTMDDSAANREFAKLFSKAKEGTKFNAKSDSKQREKSVKQSKAKEIGGASKNTNAQDVTRAAAAETKGSGLAAEVSEEAVEPKAPASAVETSAVAEPEAPVMAAQVASVAEMPTEAGRVDDMLEPKAGGPSVLRLTDSKPNEEKKAKNKPAEKVETKKQRQNRKKAEAAKAARDEAETERKALEEKQRRQARIAEGRPAKDGSQYTNATATAWKQDAPNGISQTNGTFHQPLDTFESTPTAKAQTNGVSAAAYAAHVESEHKDDNEWSTVKTKSSKKKLVSNSSSGDEETVTAPKASTKANTVSTSAAAPKSNGNSSTGKAFGGSFSALTSNNAPEEEEEEEWEV